MKTVALTRDVEIPEHIKVEMNKEIGEALSKGFSSAGNSPRRIAIAQEILALISVADAVDSLGVLPESLVADTVASFMETMAQAFYRDEDFIKSGLMALKVASEINDIRVKFNIEIHLDKGAPNPQAEELLRKASAH
jgi:hypothetical protein